MEEKRLNGKTSDGETLVIDTSAFLVDNSIEFLRNHQCYTVPEVIDEVKTMRHKICIDILQDAGALSVVEPSTEDLGALVSAAKKTGDLSSLSKTDVALLALALRLKRHGLNPLLLTDDYTIQNLASHIGIRYKGLKVTSIRRRIKWHYYCNACNSTYNEYLKRCPICGHEVKRKPARYEEL
ncbi:MAG: hypothetical protein QFX33_03445 [Candidatus Nezhaarchaeota archaeon]|nr:hypothetical protein [Candidatus Nezhaarchaeota archaeon]